MRIAPSIVVVTWLAGCAGDDGRKIVPITETGTTSTTPFVLPPELYVTDDVIYAYEATWGFANLPVREAFELNFQWDALTEDAWGLERAADSYPLLVLLQLAASEPDVEDRLAIDDLEPVITARWDLDVTGRTMAQLSELQQGGTPFDTADLVLDPAGTWLLALAEEQGGRLDIRTGLVLLPDPGVSATVVSFPNGGGSYGWTAKIDGQDEIDTSPGHPVYTLDWSGVTTDAYGKAFDPGRGDEVFVARYEDVDEGDDLSDRVLDLEATATGWWSVDPAGATSLTLEQATDSAGAPFPGFEEGVVWLVGERCSTCMGPAPLWITSIRVR